MCVYICIYTCVFKCSPYVCAVFFCLFVFCVFLFIYLFILKITSYKSHTILMYLKERILLIIIYIWIYSQICIIIFKIFYLMSIQHTDVCLVFEITKVINGLIFLKNLMLEYSRT